VAGLEIFWISEGMNFNDEGAWPIVLNERHHDIFATGDG
jgi:hypothetical protein